MRNFFHLLFLLLPLAGWAVPEPGIWASGGIAPYTLFFSNDTTTYRKVQIERELVLVQLYPGFAVLKATYWMRNTAPDTIHITAGYPINSEFHSGDAIHMIRIEFDSIYKLKVFSDGENCAVEKTAINRPIGSVEYNYNSSDTWHLWENTFPPAKLVKVDIYVLVNTNMSQMGDGWSDKNDNVFVYMPHFGLWMAPVKERTFVLQLMDGLGPGDIRGIAPDSVFQKDAAKKVIYHHSTNFPADRAIVVAYGHKVDRFNFKSIASGSETYFQTIDQLGTISSEQLSLKSFNHGDPYNFDSMVDDPILQFGLIILLGIGAVVAIIVLAVNNFSNGHHRQFRKQ